jgi:hypothetical protein
VNREQKSEATPSVPPRGAANSPPNGASARRKPAGNFRAKLPFFRMMLWVLVYAAAALFLISLILLGGFRPQTKIIGGVLLACMALVVATYVLQWRD